MAVQASPKTFLATATRMATVTALLSRNLPLGQPQRAALRRYSATDDPFADESPPLDAAAPSKGDVHLQLAQPPEFGTGAPRGSTRLRGAHVEGRR